MIEKICKNCGRGFLIEEIWYHPREVDLCQHCVMKLKKWLPRPISYSKSQNKRKGEKVSN
jgi:hypothetical protein